MVENVVVAPDDDDEQTLKEPDSFTNVTSPPPHVSAQFLEKLEGNWVEDQRCLDGDRREEVSGLKVGVFCGLPLFSPPSRVARVNVILYLTRMTHVTSCHVTYTEYSRPD